MPVGVVTSKLDLENSLRRTICDGKSRCLGIRKISLIPVPIRRDKGHRLRNEKFRKKSPSDLPESSPICCEPSVTYKNQSSSARIEDEAPPWSIADNIEESIQCLCEENGAITGFFSLNDDDGAVKVVDSENIERSASEWSSECARKVVVDNEVDDLNGAVTEDCQETNARKMTSNDSVLIDNQINNLKNSTVDFIEILTIDAKDFLATKCICKLSTSSFCKDCFNNSRDSLNLINESKIAQDLINNDEKNSKGTAWEEKLNSVNGIGDKLNDEVTKFVDDLIDLGNDCNDSVKLDNTTNEASFECWSEEPSSLFDDILASIDETPVIDSEKRCDKIAELSKNLIEHHQKLIHTLAGDPSSVEEPIEDIDLGLENNQAPLSNSASDLDPKKQLVHLVDSSGSETNSSETVPGKRGLCASRASIDADGRRGQEQAPLSSRETAVDVAPCDVSSRSQTQDSNPASVNQTLTDSCSRSDKQEKELQLTWGFKNGRLVFEETDSNLEKQVVCDTTAEKAVISSKCINKKSDINSRIKYLESKLKQAGITDVKTYVHQKDLNTPKHNNNNELNCILPECTCAKSTTASNSAVTHQYTHQELLNGDGSTAKLTQYSDFKESKDNKLFDDKENTIEGEDLIPDGSHGFCQFDVSDFSGFSTFSANQPIYDEFFEDSSSSVCSCDDEEFLLIRRSRPSCTIMVNDTSEQRKHNPDRDHLKSLLKKPGRSRDKKDKNRVVFNENKNEFFDADYIILIREDCELDEDDDDGICTCQQHEMVRLTCCEPNCNCQYDSGLEQTPQSPKFAPPMEFVDAVTLSPPEGYKDMELLARGQQRGAVCRECSATHEEELEDEGEASLSDSEMEAQLRDQEGKEKTDQSQQTTPTTPPSTETQNQNYLPDNFTPRTHQPSRNEEKRPPSSQGSPISGILKGGRLWKQQNSIGDSGFVKTVDANFASSDLVTSDEETGNRRSVRFIESEQKEKRDVCDGAPESTPEEEPHAQNLQNDQIVNENHQNLQNIKQDNYTGNSPEAPDMTLSFKLGNHVMISNNSLKPNSAVRQLFPATKTLATAQGVPEEDNNSQQYLVTSESLRAFEEAKRTKLPQIIHSGETDETIKKAIERNTLRRSLIRYEPRSKKQPYKTDNSLVERIKQLTCDVDDSKGSNDPTPQQSSIESSDAPEDVLDSRCSPPGEESRNSPDVNTLSANKTVDKSFSPSSSSTASSNSSMSIGQNYQQTRKLSNAGEHPALIRTENLPDIQNNLRREIKSLPDLGGPHNHELHEAPRGIPGEHLHCVVSNKMSSSSNTSESRRQFLSTLAPLTACVTMGVAHNEDYYYHLTNSGHHIHNQPGERVSVASSGTEYSLEDIVEGLKTEDEEHKRIAPDVLAGTPSASESGDELAMFVQQDAGRIERIKKKYQPSEPNKDNKNPDGDDEHDDYGFNRRPSVRGIKPRFSTTTEILQQIQNQLQPPAPPSSKVAWPYYSETNLATDNTKKNVNTSTGNYAYITPEDVKVRAGYHPQYRPTSLQEESMYQNCANQRPNANVYSGVIKMGNDYYQSLPLSRQRNGRPQSPPPMDMSKQYHQTMVYIPYNHIEGYQPVQYYHHTGNADYVTRVSSQNQINKRFIEPVYQSRVHHHPEEHHYNPNMVPPVPPKAINRVPYPNGQPPHLITGSRSESPLPGQFSTARATQTPAPTTSTCRFYPGNPRFRPMVGSAYQGEGNYVSKVNRHSFPSVGPRYPPADSISLTDSDSQHSGSLPNGYRQSDISLYASKESMPNSPTKPRFIERGVPEGAASVSPQDASGISQSSSSTMTSPTSPQNPPVPTNQKAMFYAMNV